MRSKSHQTITYWPSTGENAYGEESFSTPVALTGRWEERVEQIRTPTGVTITTKAIVWIPIAVAIGGYLALGDHTAVANPQMAGAWEIQDVREIPSLRTNEMERRAFL